MPFYPDLKPVEGEVFEGDFEVLHEYLRALREEIEAMRLEGRIPGLIRAMSPSGGIASGATGTVTPITRTPRRAA